MNKILNSYDPYISDRRKEELKKDPFSTYILNNNSVVVETLFYPSKNLPSNFPISTPFTFPFLDGKVCLTYDKMGWWNPLGGHIDNNETWKEALKREAREEAGVTIINILIIGYIFVEHIAGRTDLRYPSKAIIPITLSKILDYSSKWERKETKRRKLFSVENAQRVLKKRRDNNQMLEIFSHIVVNYLK